ncbi:MAG: type II toxin-antitoxin system YafQ family toxin [Chlamydiae bacterium]|nr:type II toxin-antitoxin system YafQ family toxin [Chlamydiota bacterium]
MLELEYTTQFKRDLKLSKKRGKDTDKLDKIVELLLKEKSPPEKCRDHPLSRNYKDHRECHIEPDWLLIYLQSKRILALVRTGTHADLFS